MDKNSVINQIEEYWLTVFEDVQPFELEIKDRVIHWVNQQTEPISQNVYILLQNLLIYRYKKVSSGKSHKSFADVANITKNSLKLKDNFSKSKLDLLMKSLDSSLDSTSKSIESPDTQKAPTWKSRITNAGSQIKNTIDNVLSIAQKTVGQYTGSKYAPLVRQCYNIYKIAVMAGASGVIGIPAQKWAQYMLVFHTTIETMTNDHVHEKFIRPIKDWYEWLKNMRTAARDYNSLIGSFKSWYQNKGQQHVANITGNVSSWYNKRKDEAKYL